MRQSSHRLGVERSVDAHSVCVRYCVLCYERNVFLFSFRGHFWETWWQLSGAHHMTWTAWRKTEVSKSNNKLVGTGCGECAHVTECGHHGNNSLRQIQLRVVWWGCEVGLHLKRTNTIWKNKWKYAQNTVHRWLCGERKRDKNNINIFRRPLCPRSHIDCHVA